jgi:hypothetical protein
MLKGITKKISFQEKQPQLAEITGIIRASSAAFERTLCRLRQTKTCLSNSMTKVQVTLIYWLWKKKL